MINLISIFFVKFFDLIFCTKSKHHHVVSILEEVSEMNLKIYNFYHLKLSITDYFNHIFNFMCFFLAVDWNFRNSQVLLDQSILWDFKINICNRDDIWNFEFVSFTFFNVEMMWWCFNLMQRVKSKNLTKKIEIKSIIE